MKLRSLALFLAFAFASAAAHAQAGVYLTFDAQQFNQSGIYANPASTPTGPHGNVDSPWTYGAGYGAYYDFTHVPNLLTILTAGTGSRTVTLHTGPVVLGVDGHGETMRLSEYNSTLNRQDGVFSIRAAAKSPVMKSTPYVYAGIGIGHTKIPFATNYQNNIYYQFGVGVDRKIRGRLDWRILDANAGFLNSYTVGAGPNQSNYLITLGTGFVYRLP
jgi:hypothetical protein